MGKRILTFQISSKNVHESNLFLRKLWSELNKYKRNGWQYNSYRQNNVIEIGSSNYGDVSFDYKVKGCINNIYFKNVEEDDLEYIKRAVNDAKKINETITYYCEIDFPLRSRCTTLEGLNTRFYSEGERTCIRLEIEAYSENDFKYLIGKKLEIIRAIISVYFRKKYILRDFKVKQFLDKPEELPADNTVYDYNFEWIDSDDIPMTDEKEYIIPKDMVYLVDFIIKSNFYTSQIQMMINAVQAFFLASTLKSISEEDCDCTKGCINVANAIAVSALEPLANLESIPNSKCEYCGNTQFHVLQKMRALINRYCSELHTKYVMDNYYTKRSKFFHEGSNDSDEYYTGICWPQIDENCGNKMEPPHSLIDYYLFDLVSHIIRRRCFELINDIV